MVKALDAGVDDFPDQALRSAELRARARSGQRVLDLQEGLLQAKEAMRAPGDARSSDGIVESRHGPGTAGVELDRAQRDGRPLSVVMADLDGLKHVNDTYGHLTGDDALRETAHRIRSVIRSHDGAARYGGDEFLCCCRAATIPPGDAAERARAAVAAPLTSSEGW